MKGRIFAVSSLIIALLLLEGCDVFRKLAGRPTSAELATMRVGIIEENRAVEAEQARQKAYSDSVKLARERELKSRGTLDSLKAAGSIITPAKLGGVDKSTLEGNFYIIIGAFKEKANAQRLADKVEAAGYPVRLISLKTGMNAVGICESADALEVNGWLKKVRREPFCPKEAWVLVNE